VLDFFERGDGSQITALTPPLIYKYAQGGRDFFKEARYNAKKDFLQKKCENILRKLLTKIYFLI
jgi:hypothetical protein